jgi:FMNH2-dependent dimethyl sulfone monooxygenase
MGATLDNMTGGRCAINIVNGWWQEEMDTYGNGAWLDETEARYRRMEEFILVMNGLWENETFTHHGEFYQMESGRLVQKVKRKPHPPVYAASRSNLGKDVVSRSCDAWFVDAPPGHRRFEENFEAIAGHVRDMDERCAKLGRKIDYVLNAAVLCAPTPGEAQARADDLEERSLLLRFLSWPSRNDVGLRPNHGSGRYGQVRFVPAAGVDASFALIYLDVRTLAKIGIHAHPA